MAIRYCCDWCDKQLPVTIKGEGDNKTMTAELFYPREVNVRKYFPHLCQSCAMKIDTVIGLSHARVLMNSDVLNTYVDLNRERREKLRTKG